MSEEKENIIDLLSLFIGKEEWLEENGAYLRKNFSGKFIFVRNCGSKDDWEIVFVLSDPQDCVDAVKRTHFDKKEIFYGYISFKENIVMVPTPLA